MDFFFFVFDEILYNFIHINNLSTDIFHIRTFSNVFYDNLINKYCFHKTTLFSAFWKKRHWDNIGTYKLIIKLLTKLFYKKICNPLCQNWDKILFRWCIKLNKKKTVKVFNFSTHPFYIEVLANFRGNHLFTIITTEIY